MSSHVPRTPPRPVTRALCQEVGFLCPVSGCSSPYLTWHHFDPPWRIEHHHRPEGMIALCREHADQADNGAFTDEQLREMKSNGGTRAERIRGRFNWMRQDLLAIVGSGFHYQERVIFQIGDMPCIWFDRDERSNLLLNFCMPTLSGQPRARIEQNFWSVPPTVHELICPPSGRRIEVNYGNGDRFRAEFSDLASADQLAARYPQSPVENFASRICFPVTTVEIWERAAETNIDFGPQHSRIGGFRYQTLFTAYNAVAMHIPATASDLARLFPDRQE